MNTTSEILTVNGTVLNTLATNIDSITGRLRAPGRRTSNLALPGMHGELWIPNKKFEANSIVLPMWVAGCDADGAIPSDSSARKEFFKRVNELVGVFKGTDELLDVRWTQPDGTVRQCWAEATDVFDFTADAAPTGRVGVILSIPGAFWQDVTETSQTFTGTTASVKPSKFAGSTAPMEDMVYTFVGPRTNPGITFQDGSWFAYAAALTAGQTLTVDSGEWELTGAGGLVPDYTKLSHDGADGNWGTLPPMPTAANVNLDGSATTAASSVTFTGHRKFLIG